MKITDKLDKVFEIKSFELESTESERLTSFRKLDRKYIPMATDGNYQTDAEVYGVFPIDFSRLLYICDQPNFYATMHLAADDLRLMEELQGKFDLQRKDHLQNTVNDNWGTMNPENLFVLATLIYSLKYKRDIKHVRGLFIGTGYGFPEKMAVDILGEHEIDTVDYRKDENDCRSEARVSFELDGRNKTYGPMDMSMLPGQKMGCYLPKCAKFYHGDSYDFLMQGKYNCSYDYIVLDGNHLYEAVKSDIELAFPLLKDGGFLFLDDYGGNKTSTNPGVTAAAFSSAVVNHFTGYWVSNPNDPFQTNSAFFIK